MLGPLPKLHRVVVTLAALVVCVAVGAWTASKLPTRELVAVGAGVGLGAGVACAYLLVHAAPQPRHVRRRPDR